MVEIDLKGHFRQFAAHRLYLRIIQINKNHDINIRIFSEIASGVRAIKDYLFQMATKNSGNFLNIPIENRPCFLPVIA